MSTVASHGLRKARIIAVPLARPTAKTSSKVLTYYQFQLSSQKQIRNPQAKVGGAAAQTASKRWIPEGGLSKWAQSKSAELWASFGKAKGGWKLKVYQTGEQLMDRLEFEELALKSIDPSLGPTITHPTKNAIMEKEGEPSKIALLFPPSITPSENSLAQLKQYAEYRTPIHKRGFYTWLMIAPLTAPLMIIPIIPNLPFFFCVWRSWSHYKAFKSSEYLESLIKRGLIVPEASESLDSLYKDYPPTSTPTASSPLLKGTTPRSKELLLAQEVVPAIVNRFDLHDSASGDLYRALEQARVRVENDKVDL